MALSLTKQHTFTSGTTILSSQVNTDFDDLYNALTGLEGLTKSFSNLLVDSILRSSGTIQFADGTAAAPALCLTTDTDCGIYKVASNEVGVSAAGALIGKFSSAGLVMNSLKVAGISNGTAATDAAAYGQLRVVQKVTATTSTNFATTSSSWQSTSLTVSITPTSSSNKVIVIAGQGPLYILANTVLAHATIFRGATNLGHADNGMAFSSISNAGTALYCPATLVAEDSPAATTATTYTVKVRSSDGATTAGWGGSLTCTQWIVALEGTA